MRVLSEETQTAIRALRALTQDAEGEPLHHSELTARLDGRAGNMGPLAVLILKVMAELQTLQEEKVEAGYLIDDYERLLRQGLPLEGTDRMVSLRIDADAGDPSVGLTGGGGSWLELVDLDKPQAARYGVYDNDRIDTAIQHISAALDRIARHGSESEDLTKSDLETALDQLNA